jgi:hypothetical protein
MLEDQNNMAGGPVIGREHSTESRPGTESNQGWRRLCQAKLSVFGSGGLQTTDFGLHF